MPEAKLTIIYGGTFDPVHNGHLRLVSEIALLAPEADIYMMPTGEPAHKEAPRATPDQRYQMLEIALSNNNFIKLDDREINRKGSTYTIDSLRQLKQSQPSETLVWIMGKDAYNGLKGWHQAEELAKYCHLLVVERPGTPSAGQSINKEIESVAESIGFLKATDFEQLKQQPAGLELQISIPLLDISSTRVRELLSHNKTTSWLIPDEVRAYIDINRLYQKTNRTG